MKYKLATGKYTSELEKSVNKLIEEGWIPQGGVSVCEINTEDGNEVAGCKNELQTELFFSQAMILASAPSGI